jgi:hypothetical protein
MEPHADSGHAEREGGRDLSNFQSSAFKVPILRFSHYLPVFILLMPVTCCLLPSVQ